MANHKWKDTSVLNNYKKQECIECGIERYWLYGDMQCWEYFDPRLSYERNTFYRPSCTPNLPKEVTQFGRKGNYISHIQ